MKQGGSWLAQRIAEGDVFVPEEFSEEQQMIRDSVIEFCVKEFKNLLRSVGENSRHLKTFQKSSPYWKKLENMGFVVYRLLSSMVEWILTLTQAFFLPKLMPKGFSFATTLGCQTSIGSLPIVFYGNEEQKLNTCQVLPQVN